MLTEVEFGIFSFFSSLFLSKNSCEYKIIYYVFTMETDTMSLTFRGIKRYVQKKRFCNF